MSKVRPVMRDSISKQQYLEELFAYVGLHFPRHVFCYSRELEQILELYADEREDCQRWHKAFMDLKYPNSTASSEGEQR